MAAPWLPALAGGDDQVARRARVHVQTCLRCQAELAGYRRMLRTLQGLRSDRIEPDSASLLAALQAIEDAAAADCTRGLATGRWAVYLGGMMAATAAAGAAGAAVWANRHRVGAPNRALRT